MQEVACNDGTALSTGDGVGAKDDDDGAMCGGETTSSTRDGATRVGEAMCNGGTALSTGDGAT